MNSHYYEEEDFKNILEAKSFKDLLNVALEVLNRMPQPIIQVCGPISTGGYGNPKENLAAMDRVIIHLTKAGHNIFYQLPMEDKIALLDKEWKSNNPGKDYCLPILEEIYLPIFESGIIKTLWFLPNWESSRGATWEREEGKRLGLEIMDLPLEWDKVNKKD